MNVPWMRWHVSKWRNSPRVLRMSLAAQGAYRNLLDAAWEMGGKLPNDPEILWRYALAKNPAEFEAVAAEVTPMFTPTGDGRFLVNDSLAAEREDAEARMRRISHARSEAGKRGNEKRWGSQNRKPSQADRKLSHRTEWDMRSEAKPCASARAEGASSKAAPDPRHKPTELRIKQRHKEKFGIDCQWDGSDGRALATVLRANQGWMQEHLNSMVDNVFASKKTMAGPVFG